MTDDDRLPVVLVVLDGLGDRGVPALGDATPAEAAATPTLDALARRGSSGWHLPFGPGPAPASELAHWAMFGLSAERFPGRAVLEALGAGIPVPPGVAVTHAALRRSRVDDGGRRWITGRATSGDDDGGEVGRAFALLEPVLAAHGAALHPLAAGGEALLVLHGHADGDVTDSDPFFEHLHPWLRVLPRTPSAAGTADALTALLRDAAGALAGSGALDVVTTKWSGALDPGLPSFADVAGVPGGLVTSSRLYRGFAALLGTASRDLPVLGDVAADLRARLSAADELIADGARFVHVHTKATDEAGHSKDPHRKLAVIEAADAGLDGLLPLAGRAVVAVTGDHATPSTAGVLHTGDPTPLVVAGPTVREDPVTAFGEAPAHAGWLGTLRAAELAPLIFGLANRPVFLGHRPTPRRTLALPDAPEPMPPP